MGQILGIDILSCMGLEVMTSYRGRSRISELEMGVCIWVSFSKSVQLGTYNLYIYIYIYMYIHVYSYVPIVHSGKN